MIAFFIIGIVFFILCVFVCIFGDVDDNSFALGFGITITFLMALLSGFVVFSPKKDIQTVKDVQTIKIDTTFTTTNHVTDTTYTIYYTKIKED